MVYQTLLWRFRAVPRQSLRARSKCDIAPGPSSAATAGLARCAACAGSATASASSNPAAAPAPIGTRLTTLPLLSVLDVVRRAEASSGDCPGQWWRVRAPPVCAGAGSAAERQRLVAVERLVLGDPAVLADGQQRGHVGPEQRPFGERAVRPGQASVPGGAEGHAA